MMHDDLPDLQKGLMEIPLLGAVEIGQGRRTPFCEIPDDIDHPLEGDGQGLKIGMRFEGLHRQDLRLRLHEIVDPRGKHRVHDVVRMVLGDELIFEPAFEEFQDRGFRLAG